MMRLSIVIVLTLGSFSSTIALAAPLPTRVGECSETKITGIGYRFEGDPNSGSWVSYSNEGYQISFTTSPQMLHSKIGDEVKLCLVEIPPHDCPEGDDRGRVFRATNLRTGESWDGYNSLHSCGGA
jgi:hypothetical protein